jgi:hypothetical protein
LSLTKPHFGEVFRYHKSLIMYICPAEYPDDDWIGMRLTSDFAWDEPGEIAQRVPLLNSRWSEWVEIDDEGH